MSQPHYGGNLVDGAHILGLFGDVATELCVLADGDEGLFRAYESVEFLAPVYSGDFIEATGEIIKWGKTSLKMRFTARKIVAPLPALSASAAGPLSEPIVVCRATGTCVVPESSRRAPQKGERIGRPGPCILTAAIIGAETTRQQNPHLPLTPDEIGDEATRCQKAGATVIHLHVRDDQGRASQDTERFRAAIRAIRARCDIIIQTSTGGAVGMSIDERCGPLLLAPERPAKSPGGSPTPGSPASGHDPGSPDPAGKDAPEMATLNVGTINFGDDIFVNRRPDTQEIARRIATRGLVPEIEIYDLGHLDIARELCDKGLLFPPLHVQFVLGVRGALSASQRNVELLVERLLDLPGPVTFCVAGIGRHQLPMAAVAAQLGGNIRVGLEDNIYLDKGVLAQGSAPLVERAAQICHEHGRQVATLAQAREILLSH